MPAQTTHQSQALIQQPFLVEDKHSTGINTRVKSTDDALCTVDGSPRVKLVMPFITKGENSSNLNNFRSTTEETQTQTTRQTMGLLVPPYIIELKKTSTARDLSKPLACATTIGYHGLISNDAANSFLAAYNNGSHCLNHITEAAGTMPTKERFSLVQNTQSLKVEDCFYRMLKAHEIQSAMAFNPEYVILGSQKDKVKQLGNAVTPPAMKWLVGQVKESLS